MKDLLLVTSLFFVFTSINAQFLHIDDTVKINDVVVRPDTPDGRLSYHKSEYNTSVLSDFSGNTLAEFLASASSLNIRSYGTGGVSSISIRGMGANHTKVKWEGLELNNPMLGQSDFSILPLIFFDKVSIYHGGNPKTFGNRGSGGTIDLSSAPVFTQGTDISVITEYGSFERLSQSLSISSSNKMLEMRTKAYFKSAKNNFPYVDRVNQQQPLSILREDSEYTARGILQEVFLRKPRALYTAKIWYNYNDRSLPGSIFTSNNSNNESQTDESIKAVLGAKIYSHSMRINIQTAYISDWLGYTNNIADIFSRNKVRSYTASADVLYKFREHTEIVLGTNSTLSWVSSNNYLSHVRRSHISFDFELTRKIVDQLSISANIKQELLDSELIPVSPSVGIDYKPFRKINLHFLGSIGRSNHLPGLNDLYWNPGGNPDLLPELSINREFSINYSSGNEYAEFNTNLTVYSSSIENMIQWVPVTSTVWSPLNLNEVISKGVEFSDDFIFRFGESKIKFSGSYTYTKVSQSDMLPDQTGKIPQLVYVPLHSYSSSISYSFNEIRFNFKSNFIGKRFTSQDNLEFLDSYMISDFSVYRAFNIRKTKIRPGIIVNNIFAVDYQSVIGYPMPGRMFNITIKINFNSNE